MTHALIPPDVAIRLKHLRLAPRRAIGARGIGQHRSRSRGAGLEFVQYRAYEAGDELRQIDWKLYARSDRLFVREAERESPLTVWLLIDASASMAQTDRAGSSWSRMDAARCLAACIAELALQQADRFGFVGLREDALQLLPAASGPRARDRLWLALQSLSPGGRFPQGEHLNPVWERIGAGDLVVMLSDGFDEAAIALLEQLAAAGRDAIFIQLLTSEERDFPFRGGWQFVDAENAEQLSGEGETLRAEYLQRFELAQRHLDARLDAAGIVHVRHVLDEPLHLPLQRLFAAPDGA